MKKVLLIAFACMLTAMNFSYGQNQKLDLTKPINPDPKVKIGKLDNGMTYYIRHNEYPKNRVELRLAVNAGSNQENENQRGLAHFTEHMAFNGIEGFPGNTMVDELQKIGVVFGADLNAYTSFDETVYMIPMPLDNPNNLDMGLKILRGWANGLLYDNKEIDDERGVISEEYRLGLGADDRMRKEWWPVLMKDSRYATRMPIGLIEIIQGFEYQLIKDFYHDWYRPDLQAVIVVGDIDVDAVEAKIKTMFGNIKPIANPRVKEDYPIGMNKEPLVSVCTDKEASGNTVMLIRKFPHFAMKTIGDFRKQLAIDLYNTMFDARLTEMQQDPKCPFIGASAGYGQLIGSTDEYALYASSKENRIIETIQTLMREDYRVLQHGFLQTELDRAKVELLDSYERAANEVEKTESSRFASEYINHFLHHDPIPGAKREYNYAQKMLDDITLQEINAMAKEWITPENFVAIVTAPNKEGVTVPTKEQVLQTIQDPSLKNVSAYVDTYKDQEIVERSSLTPGSVVKSEDLPSINGKQLTLSNGIKVILKPTTFKNDQILFSAISHGGFSLCKESDLLSAYFASSIIDRAGIAELDYNTLMKKMKGKSVGITPFIGATNEGFQGSSTPKDLEFFFQYLHAFFAAPRIDTAAKALVMDETSEQIKMLNANAMYRFFGAFLDASQAHNPYEKTVLSFTQEDLDKVDFDRAVKIYKERFANPADFTFVFVGNYDEKTITDLINIYLGSLKTNPNEKEAIAKEVFQAPAKESVRENVYFGAEQQGWLGIDFSSAAPYSTRNAAISSIISDALDVYLVQIIREKMGGVYSPMAQVGLSKYPEGKFELMIMLGCNPDNTDMLTDACIKILKNIQKKGVDKKTLAKVKKQIISTREKDIQTNSFWSSYIYSKVFYNGDLNDVNNYNDLINSITNKEIISFLQSYLNLDVYTRVDLYPESAKKE